jgi:hypothetical protein
MELKDYQQIEEIQWLFEVMVTPKEYWQIYQCIEIPKYFRLDSKIRPLCTPAGNAAAAERWQSPEKVTTGSQYESQQWIAANKVIP